MSSTWNIDIRVRPRPIFVSLAPFDKKEEFFLERSIAAQTRRRLRAVHYRRATNDDCYRLAVILIARLRRLPKPRSSNSRAAEIRTGVGSFSFS
jgi:hypothetical protein